ncbi:enoyl-CoA hydratase/isomerase family protein [Mumia sp. DW29H23]|uniref:enoyl-CoA hydratase/isomerase family protein n=1 Tax=Mumia sp. DW29H23 TaxID=3421241 RepID=UPI003D69A503
MSIEVARDGGVVEITLNAPERRNALSPEEFAELGDVLRQVAGSSADRAVLITGAPGAFCSGAHLAETVPDDSVVAIMGRIHEAARALHRLPQPVVAAVGGPAYGAGMSIALAADLTLASERAVFCQVFVKRGLVPDFGSSWLLPRIVGMQAAKRLALLGEPVGADEAAALGIVAEVVPDDTLAVRAREVACRLAAGAPVAQRLTKQLLHASYETSFDTQLDAEAAAAAVATGTSDVAEAFAAFAQKRDPVFTGR